MLRSRAFHCKTFFTSVIQVGLTFFVHDAGRLIDERLLSICMGVWDFLVLDNVRNYHGCSSLFFRLLEKGMIKLLSDQGNPHILSKASPPLRKRTTARKADVHHVTGPLFCPAVRNLVDARSSATAPETKHTSDIGPYLINIYRSDSRSTRCVGITLQAFILCKCLV